MATNLTSAWLISPSSVPFPADYGASTEALDRFLAQMQMEDEVTLYALPCEPLQRCTGTFHGGCPNLVECGTFTVEEIKGN